MRKSGPEALFLLTAGMLMSKCMHARGVLSKQSSSFSERFTSTLPTNAISCAECHSIPSMGGSSSITVRHAALQDPQTHAIVGIDPIIHLHNEDPFPRIGQHIFARAVLSTLGDGYVEAVPDITLQNISKEQMRITKGLIHGECHALMVGGGAYRIGRFGWKAEHGSILSASMSAASNEIGFPSHLSELDVQHVQQFVAFIRSTDPVMPDPARATTSPALAGKTIFNQIGCSLCHIPSLRTAPSGTLMTGSKDIVTERLGGKEIYPFSDYLLHDVGTTDLPGTSGDKFRTAPLWGLRYRSWMMHDAKSKTYHQAIMRHAGEASQVVQGYVQLTPLQKEQLRIFLNSL